MRATVDWDHEWMEHNWRSYADEVIAVRFRTSVDTVKGYRLRRGWRRPEQRYNGGPRALQPIKQSIADVVRQGVEIRLFSFTLGRASHIVLTATQNGLTTEPYIVHGLTCMPRILGEAMEELRTKMKFAQ